MKTNLLLLSIVALSLNSFASDKGVDRRQDLLIEAQQMDKEDSAKKNTVRNQQEINDSVNNSVKTYEIEEVYGGEEIIYSQTVDLQVNVNHYELSRLNIRNALARIYNIPLETEEQKQEWRDFVDQTYFDADAIIAQAEVDELEKKEVPNFYALLNQLLNERLQREVSFSMRPLKMDLVAFRDHLKLAYPKFRELNKSHLDTFHMLPKYSLTKLSETHLPQMALKTLNNANCEELNGWKEKAEEISIKSEALITLEMALDKTLDEKECLKSE